MARRPIRGLFALLVGLAVAACADASVEPITTEAPTTSSPTTPSTTTTSLPTRTVPPTTVPALEDIDAEVVVPEGEGPFPAVVLVHGGGWVTGDPGIMDPLAGHLNDNGFLTVNTRYELADFDHPGYPTAVEDVACAVRYAAGHPDGDGTVAVIGHSAGAHIGALVALTGDDYVGPCPYQGSGIPDRFVGLAGPYDVSRLGLAIAAFFGGGPERIPDAWAAGNPQLLTDENPGLLSLIMYGELDGIVPRELRDRLRRRPDHFGKRLDPGADRGGPAQRDARPCPRRRPHRRLAAAIDLRSS
jgi:dienelactone hydrolase